MKLRIDPDKISFRIDLSELEQLLDKGKIHGQTPLPKDSLSYTLIRLPPGSDARFQAQDNSYILSLPQDIIEAHKATLPSLKGIITLFPCQNGDSLQVALEVNLKKKLKHSLER